MNTVILLGAGASIAAGYPSANDLFSQLEKFAQETFLGQVHTDWATWVEFRESEQFKLVELLFKAVNPEIVLSALDILQTAKDDVSRGLFGIAAALMKEQSPPHGSDTYRYLSRNLNDDFGKQSMQARYALLRCIVHYMEHKTSRDPDFLERRNYLRRLFADLKEGDTVITFNWDATAEMTLGEMGLWNPTTGYGFEKKLLRSGKADVLSPSVIPSAVRVLKLHGSVGWKRELLDRKGEDIYLDTYRLLPSLNIKLEQESGSFTFIDPHYDRRSHEDTAIVVPSFLKAVPEGTIMQRIWHLAADALAKAQCLIVWGYSLPPSDGAARMLLNSMRFRSVDITVGDPSGDTRDRWDEFIGRSVSHHARLE